MDRFKKFSKRSPSNSGVMVVVKNKEDDPPYIAVSDKAVQVDVLQGSLAAVHQLSHEVPGAEYEVARGGRSVMHSSVHTVHIRL